MLISIIILFIGAKILKKSDSKRYKVLIFYQTGTKTCGIVHSFFCYLFFLKEKLQDSRNKCKCIVIKMRCSGKSCLTAPGLPVTPWALIIHFLTEWVLNVLLCLFGFSLYSLVFFHLPTLGVNEWANFSALGSVIILLVILLHNQWDGLKIHCDLEKSKVDAGDE